MLHIYLWFRIEQLEIQHIFYMQAFTQARDAIIKIINQMEAFFLVVF